MMIYHILVCEAPTQGKIRKSVIDGTCHHHHHVPSPHGKVAAVVLYLALFFVIRMDKYNPIYFYVVHHSVFFRTSCFFPFRFFLLIWFSLLYYVSWYDRNTLTIYFLMVSILSYFIFSWFNTSLHHHPSRRFTQQRPADTTSHLLELLATQPTQAAKDLARSQSSPPPPSHGRSSTPLLETRYKVPH